MPSKTGISVGCCSALASTEGGSVFGSTVDVSSNVFDWVSYRASARGWWPQETGTRNLTAPVCEW